MDFLKIIFDQAAFYSILFVILEKIPISNLSYVVAFFSPD